MTKKAEPQKKPARGRRGITSEQVDERTLKHRLADELSLDDLTKAHAERQKRAVQSDA